MATKANRHPQLTAMMKLADNEMATIADDGIIAGDVTKYISTGSYALNALLSGSIFKGLSGNRITGFSAESSTGKCARGSQPIKVAFKTEKERDAFLAKARRR